MLGPPLAPLRFHVTPKGNARAVVVVDVITVDEGVTGWTPDDHDAAVAEPRFRSIVVSVG